MQQLYLPSIENIKIYEAELNGTSAVFSTATHSVPAEQAKKKCCST
jgi:hypothetical protein